jgi:hypothetical protein
MKPPEEGDFHQITSYLERCIIWERLSKNICVEQEDKIRIFFTALLKPSDFDDDDCTDPDDQSEIISDEEEFFNKDEWIF